MIDDCGITIWEWTDAEDMCTQRRKDAKNELLHAEKKGKVNSE